MRYAGKITNIAWKWGRVFIIIDNDDMVITAGRAMSLKLAIHGIQVGQFWVFDVSGGEDNNYMIEAASQWNTKGE